MKKLIHVVRGRPDFGQTFSFINAEGEPIRLREAPMLVNPRELSNVELEYPMKGGEFFLINALDVDVALPILASTNPGCEIRVYAAELIAQCPAAAMVSKKISPHGILPNI